MRTLLALILGWFMPARGKHRTEAAEAVAPATVRLICRRRPKEFGPLVAEEVALVRPYVIVWEREQERRRQRERRRAAVLATLGQDYAGGAA
ncbi:hypothetical protein [Streptomyces sp. NPDC002346]